MALDATAGRTPAQRLLLSAIDTGAKESDPELISLVQGNGQGSLQMTTEELLDMMEEQLRAAGLRITAAPESSLVQGKTQGSFEKEAHLRRKSPPDRSDYKGEPFLVNGGVPPFALASRPQLVSSAAAFPGAG